jgi:exonuclease SbcC
LAGHSTDRIATLDAKIKDLNYDADLHQATKERILKLDRYSELHIRLQNAKSDLPEEAKALDLVVSMTDRRKQEIDGIERAFAELSSRLESLGGSEAKLANFSERLAKLESEKSSLNELIGALRERIANLHELAANVAEKTKLRHKAASEKSIYDELGRAFGKNGIQALVIETVIPQITEQASELLNRLTDGQMSMRLELSAGRRDRTTGEPAEQLEIKIADEMGTRSYETFSGGEAFRINFAIRIALSRLLASRSGAPLPILFIDEGFGSQDGTGQDRLREAIASIEDEFQKILVITHIDAVKDSFPVRIEVQKTAAGSTFTVS